MTDAHSGEVGIVVVGRNEGARLLRSLASARATGVPVVYVDSRSSDGSADAARGLGVRVVELTAGPLTAARGRRAGFDALLAAHPGVRFVQFIDGDCVLHEFWLERALACLRQDERVGCVTGRRREENADRTGLAALVDIDWDVPPGRVAHPGGDSLCRVSALKEIGGWNADLIAGEDPDLGFRMTDAGWQVLRLADDMTSHDIAMKTLGPYVRRAVRSGYAYAEVGWRNRNGCGRAWLRHAVGIVLYGAMLPLVTMAILALYWPLVVVPALLYARMFACMLRYVRGRGRPFGLAVRYGILNAACKPAAAWGVGRYLLDVIAGRRGRLIEYKPGVASPGSSPMTRAGGAVERRA